MYISYDYYRIFYYVVKFGSFTKAAEKLMSNQPNLSRAVKTLETELNCTLLIRSNKGVTLTPDGQKLYEHISVAVEQIQAAEEEISLNKELRKGTISIGASEIALRCFLLPILNRFRKLYPSIGLKVSNHSTPQAISFLKKDAVDFSVVTTPVEISKELKIEKLKDFNEVAVCGSAFASLAKQHNITVKQLSDYPLISLEKQTKTYEFLSRYFSEKGVHFTPDVEVATAEQILPMVKHNLGIGFVPDEFLKNETDCDDIIRLTLKEPIPPRSVCLITKRNHPLSLAANELKKLIIDSKEASKLQLL